MPVSERIEAVISAYKEILVRDIGLVVEGRSVRLYVLCKGIPHQLRLMGDGPPRRQCPPMDIQMLQLASSAAICRVRPLTGIALAVPVIPCHVTCGAVGVSNQYGRPELGHSLSLQVLGWELPSKYLGASTKMPIISDLFKNKSSSGGGGGSRCLLTECYIFIPFFFCPGGVGRSNPH